MATISNTPRPGYVFDVTDNVWYPIGTGSHNHSEIASTIVDAKGDIITASAADTPARLAVGANATVLTADSTEATGLKWATPSSGGMTLLSTTTLTGSSVTLSSIPQTYKNLQLIIRNFKPVTDNSELIARFNGDANARYNTLSSPATNNTYTATNLYVAERNDNSVATGLSIINIYDYTNTTTTKYAQSTSITVNATTTANFNYVFYSNFYNQIDAISSIYLAPDSGNFTSGTALLYGVS